MSVRRGLVALVSAMASTPCAAGPVVLPAGSQAVPFAALPGFAADDHAAAFRAFRATCAAVVGATPPTRPATAPPPALRAACAAATALRGPVAEPASRRFFEQHFTPMRLPAPAFFTGYYEPVVAGSLTRSATYRVPLLASPPGLASAGAGQPWTWRMADGTRAVLPDRAGIEAGALGGAAKPLAWVREPADAFFIQVQGSARILLPDGTTRRLAYAGRNGYPYTAIGKVLVDTLGIPPDQMKMSDLRRWIRDHGQAPGEAGAALMAQNRSFIFFHWDGTLPAGSGPVGAANVPLQPLRTLAVDRAIWPYGLPFYVAADLPWQDEAATPFQRVAVAADTGSAIIGPTRADIFFGTGDAAGALAGGVRHPGTLYVLWPKPLAAPSRAPSPAAQ